MEKKKNLTVLLLFLSITGGIISAQGKNSEMKLSLKEAQDYALTYNKSVKSARYDIESSRYGLWNAISSGLLQVNGNGIFNDNVIVATAVIDFNGVPTPLKFGTDFDMAME